MALSWTEIKDRALRFANEWKDEASEDAEAKSFWDACYRPQHFASGTRRIEFLFQLREHYSAPLMAGTSDGAKKRAKKPAA